MTFYLKNVSTLRELWAYLSVCEGVAFDMESVNDEVIGLGIGDSDVGCYASGDEHIVTLLEGFHHFQDATKIAHNAKADLRALGAHRAEWMYPLFDTMIAAYLTGDYPLVNLTDLTDTILHKRLRKYEELLKEYNSKDLSTVPEEAIARYNLAQISATYYLWDVLRAYTDPKVFLLEMDILPILCEMEENGILVDKKKLIALGNRFKMEGDSLQEAVREMTNNGIQNVNSPKQVSEYIFGTLGARAIYRSKRTKAPQTSERVLKKLLEKDPEKFGFLRILLRARQVKKNVNTYCFGIANRLDYNNRSHTQLSQITAETGRLASKEPNHQNIPKRRPEGLEVRRCMIAPPGHLLIACDMDQLELRLIAEESEEPRMREAFLQGEDIHMRTALQLFNDPTKRFAAKVLNYTIVYLAGAQQIADQVGRSKAVAEMWQEKYFRTYNTLRAWIDEWARICQERGYVETWLGRRRDMTRYFQMNYEEGMRKSVNTRIQGTAAEVLKLAMIRVDDRMRIQGMRSKLLMQIHDELLVESPMDEVEEAKRLLKEEMTTMYKRMPLPCTVKVGENWGDVH